MRFMSTKSHAVGDYLGGILLIAIPMIWFDRADAAVWVPMIVGAVMLLQSLFTDYELSLANIIPVPAHLGMDAIAGAFLATSPWLFGFYETVWMPHLIVGLLEIGAALTTQLHRSSPAISPDRHYAA